MKKRKFCKNNLSVWKIIWENNWKESNERNVKTLCKYFFFFFFFTLGFRSVISRLYEELRASNSIYFILVFFFTFQFALL